MTEQIPLSHKITQLQFFFHQPITPWEFSWEIRAVLVWFKHSDLFDLSFFVFSIFANFWWVFNAFKCPLGYTWQPSEFILLIPGCWNNICHLFVGLTRQLWKLKDSETIGLRKVAKWHPEHYYPMEIRPKSNRYYNRDTNIVETVMKTKGNFRKRFFSSLNHLLNDNTMGN